MHSSRYLVAGIGKTGQSFARYLQRQRQPFVVFDTREAPDGLAEFQALFPDVEVFLRDIPETLYPQLITILTSPGVNPDDPVMKKAMALNIPIYGDIECLVREIDSPIIAITGTNGKSTVTTLVGEMAKEAGRRVAVAGNIGQPVLDLLDKKPYPYDLWVLELSSFQLDLTQSLSAAAATILNVTPDHLDRHHTFENYVSAKQRIYHGAQFMLYNREDRATIPEKNNTIEPARLSSFGLDKPSPGHWGIQWQGKDSYLAFGDELILATAALRIKGKHNWANALTACALASAVGIPLTSMKAVLQRFSGLPHRTEWVRTIDEVDWINDSKGTNIGATISAISGLANTIPGKIVLIAGGQGKGADFRDLRPVMDHIRLVVLIGEDADKIESALADKVTLCRVASLEAAVNDAHRAAKPGDVVLLSPACASLDMFRDYNHRGEVFVNAVNAL